MTQEYKPLTDPPESTIKLVLFDEKEQTLIREISADFLQTLLLLVVANKVRLTDLHGKTYEITVEEVA